MGQKTDSNKKKEICAQPFFNGDQKTQLLQRCLKMTTDLTTLNVTLNHLIIWKTFEVNCQSVPVLCFDLSKGSKFYKQNGKTAVAKIQRAQSDLISDMKVKSFVVWLWNISASRDIKWRITPSKSLTVKSAKLDMKQNV